MWRKSLTLLLAVVLLAFSAPLSHASTVNGGPIVLMGIDGDDLNHGPVAVYVKLMQDVMSKSTKTTGSGILVIGAGKNPSDRATVFWTSVKNSIGYPVTFVNGAANIQNQSFANFKMIAIASDSTDTSGGLTVAENDALVKRKGDIADFINSGGGLFSMVNYFSQPYAFLSGIANFTLTFGDYDNITATPEGTAVGISDALDVGYWHAVFTSYPNNFKVLATRTGTTQAAAIGGASIVIVDDTPPVTALTTAPAEPTTGWFRTNVIAQLAATDDISGVAKTEYRMNGGSWTTYSAPFEVSTEGDTTIEYRSTDKKNNQETAHSKTIHVDKTTSLTMAETSPGDNGTGWYTSDVTVKLTATDSGSGIADIQYRLNSGTWKIYTSPFVLNAGITQVDYMSNDKAGNAEPYHNLYISIDKQHPVINMTTQPAAPQAGTWFTSDVAVTLTADEAESGMAGIQYQLDGSAWNDYTASFNVSDGIHMLNYRGKDLAGNSSAESSSSLNIDKTAPVAPTVTASTTGWSRSPVTVTVADGSDAGSGVAKSQYKIGSGGEWIDYANPITVSSEGEQTVYARTIDKAGNVSIEANVTLKIDQTAPTEPAVTASATDWTKDNVTVSVTDGSDVGSGVAKSQYKIGMGGTWTDYAGPVTVSNEGESTVYSHTVDFAGNVSAEAIVTLKIDKTAPTAPVVTASQSDWTKGSVTVAVTDGTDAGSGVAKSQYKIGSAGVWTDYASLITVTSEGETVIYARTLDLVGNLSAEASASARIDKTAPTAPTVTASASGWTNGNVAVTVTSGSDAGSGVRKDQYKFGTSSSWVDYTGSVTVSSEGDNTVSARSQDRAGNIGPEASVIVMIDKTAPTITSQRTPPNANGWNSSAVTVSFACSDALSGLHNCTQPVTVSTEGANQQVTGTATDKAGNVVNAIVTGINIDKTAPVIQWNGSATYSVTQAVYFSCTATDALSGLATNPCTDPNVNGIPAYTLGIGTHTVSVQAIDNAGNQVNSVGIYVITLSYNDLRELTRRFVTEFGAPGYLGVVNSLIVKIDNFEKQAEKGKNKDLNAYINELSAIRGTKIAPDKADILIALARLL